ncbi:hypothetical protein GALL_407260 [mine drainage metagenome]|uniref:Uncharacterized protein n=1 Tax=mine drainage metagenome TaxID=410659 RepID=A0A1J5Q1N1_9ZZZZ
MAGTMTFSEASDDARLRGAGNYHAQKLKAFRQWLAEDTVEVELDAMSSDELKNVKYELEKIQARAARLASRIAKGRPR